MPHLREGYYNPNPPRPEPRMTPQGLHLPRVLRGGKPPPPRLPLLHRRSPRHRPIHPRLHARRRRPSSYWQQSSQPTVLWVSPLADSVQFIRPRLAQLGVNLKRIRIINNMHELDRDAPYPNRPCCLPTWITSAASCGSGSPTAS